MKKWITGATLILAIVMSSCNEDGLDALGIVDSNFETGLDGWEAEFAEYSSKTDTSELDLAFARTALPRSIDSSQHAFMIQSHNRSDDMFMYLKKKVTGFIPNETYSLVFDINLATQSAEGSVGIGGSPAHSIYLKAGAAGTEPTTTLKGTEYVFSLDKGQQSQSGTNAIVLGDLSNGEEEEKFTLIQRGNADKPFNVKANAKGEIWLFVGTDSGFEGLTTLYYNRIKVTIRQEHVN